MPKEVDLFAEQKLNRLQLMVYMLPLVGAIAGAWTLSQGQGNTQQRSLSRLSVTLTLAWLILYALLWTGASYGDETIALRLLYTNGLITTGYLLACLGMMLRIWQKK